MGGFLAAHILSEVFSIHVDHVVEGLLELVVDGLALLFLADQLVLQLVDLEVDPLHVHLPILSPALSILSQELYPCCGYIKMTLPSI